MREINSIEITNAIKQLVIDANYNISDDIYKALNDNKKSEKSKTGKEILAQIIDNADLAKESAVAMCQDTGMCVVFVELGQDVHIVGELLDTAINKGVKAGYEEGYLRKSVVDDPLSRVNTNDNTPAVIHTSIVAGHKINIKVMPKGFGSENMSKIKMLKPSDGVEGVKDFVLETVSLAGPNACPPIIVGVGIGGTFEKSALLAKKSLLRPISSGNSDLFYKNLEDELLTKINKLGIGPGGLGGSTTALKVQIETYPTHIAGLPVAINITCHASRHKEITL